MRPPGGLNSAIAACRLAIWGVQTTSIWGRVGLAILKSQQVEARCDLKPVPFRKGRKKSGLMSSAFALSLLVDVLTLFLFSVRGFGRGISARSFDLRRTARTHPCRGRGILLHVFPHLAPSVRHVHPTLHVRWL